MIEHSFRHWLYAIEAIRGAVRRLLAVLSARLCFLACLRLLRLRKVTRGAISFVSDISVWYSFL